jgi:glycosyltransferase involved in cell wall biosynthesis
MIAESNTPNKIHRTDNPLISIVVPVYNEEQAIPAFLSQIRSTVEKIDCRFELLFVNDGSTDDTLTGLLSAAHEDSRIKILNLSRRFGKELALSAGLDHALGDAMIPIDADLQDPPELIPEFIRKWQDGYDMVYGIRAERASDSVIKRNTASAFYKLFNAVSRTRIPENAGDFRLLDRKLVEILKTMPERNRFMKGLFAWLGFKSLGIPYQRQARSAGQTKWGFWRLWNFALDGIFGFSTVPLRIWTYVGAFIAALSFLYAILIVTRTLIFGIDLPGYASLMAVVLFIGGIQLLSLGVIGEYLGRLYIEAKGRPKYIVEKVYSSTEEQET